MHVTGTIFLSSSAFALEMIAYYRFSAASFNIGCCSSSFLCAAIVGRKLKL
jgi:hypothetical protein